MQCHVFFAQKRRKKKKVGNRAGVIMSLPNIIKELYIQDSGVALENAVKTMSTEKEPAENNDKEKGVENNRHESTILSRIKHEKELTDSIDKVTETDLQDYSILMYETQDAFKHSRMLRFKLNYFEDCLMVKTLECDELLKAKEELETQLKTFKTESKEREAYLQKKILHLEESLIELSGRNAWLEGKYEEYFPKNTNSEGTTNCEKTIIQGDIRQVLPLTSPFQADFNVQSHKETEELETTLIPQEYDELESEHQKQLQNENLKSRNTLGFFYKKILNA